jgi:short-subunit dehydrogenase
MLMGWMRFCGKHCCRAKMQAKNRMAQLYNKSGGSWAVISGGSDGIGYEMCRYLGAQGFNICIVARNETKMQEKLAEIKKECPSIETKYIVADLGTMFGIEDYQTIIGD